MARPRTITDEEILAAARALFLEKGISVTAAQVAERCGVGEATVFRRFPTKHALFRAALAFEGEPPFAAAIVESIGAEDFRKTLVELGTQMIAWARKVLPARLMSFSNPLAEGQRRRPLLLVIDKALRELFEAAHRSGKLQARDPAVAAHIFLGALRDHALREVLKASGPVSEQALLEGLASLLCIDAPTSKLRKARPRSLS